MPLIAASFKAQFPQGEKEDSIKKEVNSLENQTEPFDKVSLNIGWQLHTDNQIKLYSGKPVLGETTYKHCLGAVVCNNNSYCSHRSCTEDYPEKQACPLKRLERRPKSKPDLIMNQTCSYCQQLVSWKECSVTVQFKQFKEGARYEMTHKGKHSHGEYETKHLTKAELRRIDNIVKANPLITPKEAVVGISSKQAKSQSLSKRSAIYVPHLTKHVVIFQAVISGLEYHYFESYFVKFFDHFNIKRKKFLGMVMDYSAAQTKVFLAAFGTVFLGRSRNGPVTYDGLEFLKGCYWHWMQSVQRMIKNGKAVRDDQKEQFTKLCYQLRTSKDEEKFKVALSTINEEFPGYRRWLKWWYA